MSRGLKIIMLAIAGLAAIGAIVYFVIVPLFSSAPAPATAVNNNVPVAPPVNANANANVNTPPANVPPPPATVSPETQQASAARSVARTFAERLDTYSNRNGLINLNDLQALSTPAVWKYIDGEYRASLLKSLPDAKTYYSVTSTAMSINTTSSAADQVDATIQMQRVEAGTVSKISYVVLNLKLKNVDNAWLVSWLEWAK